MSKRSSCRAWKQINLDGHDDHVTGLGAGASLIVGDIATLTVQVWAGPHTHHQRYQLRRCVAYAAHDSWLAGSVAGQHYFGMVCAEGSGTAVADTATPKFRLKKRKHSVTIEKLPSQRQINIG